MSPRRKRPGRSRTDLPGALYPTLDLHGLTGSEAVAAARAWLEGRRLESEPVVRLITGRGRHSTGPAVLPGEIENLLQSLPRVVARYERESGGGAYQVRLHPPTLQRKPEPIGLPSDPRLLRQAEEALAELGIQPTPALLAAEIERIRSSRGK